VRAHLPQLPGNSGPEGLGFAKEGFCTLLSSGLTGQDLRVGAVFTGDRARIVATALVEKRTTIARMPAKCIRYLNASTRVFEACPSRPERVAETLSLTPEFLHSYGTLQVPGHVWRGIQRLSAWLEPVLMTEWARLMRSYGERMARTLASADIEVALTWLDPVRDTKLARDAVARLRSRGYPLTCVWTGTRLADNNLDIDHCLPWTAWPCSDLWNLLPASRRANQHLKGDRLPSSQVLAHARDAIVAWWEAAWLGDKVTGDRFTREAAAFLDLRTTSADEIFAGLEWRRLRLQQDHQLIL
jgi:hypothetical protein